MSAVRSEAKDNAGSVFRPSSSRLRELAGRDIKREISALVAMGTPLGSAELIVIGRATVVRHLLLSTAAAPLRAPALLFLTASVAELSKPARVRRVFD